MYKMRTRALSGLTPMTQGWRRLQQKLLGAGWLLTSASFPCFPAAAQMTSRSWIPMTPSRRRSPTLSEMRSCSVDASGEPQWPYRELHLYRPVARASVARCCTEGSQDPPSDAPTTPAAGSASGRARAVHAALPPKEKLPGQDNGGYAHHGAEAQRGR